MSEEFATPTASAETTGSAPVTPETPVQAVNTESAPVEESPATEVNSEPANAGDGSAPSKAVEELKAQRRKRQEAEREAAYWRGVAEAKGFKPEATPEPVQVKDPYADAPVAPNIDNFETFEEYERAKDRYLIQQAKYELATEVRQAQQRVQHQTAEQRFRQKLDAEAAKDPTFRDVITDPTLPLHEAHLPLVMESEMAPEIFRWLHRNRQEASRIFNLPPLYAAREFGKIEALVQAAPKPEPPKRVSAAPEPIKPVSPVTPAVTEEDDLPMAEYHRRLTQRMYGRR